MHNIALLTSVGDPLLGYLLEQFQISDIKVSAVVVDQKGWTSRDYSIHSARVGTLLPNKTVTRFEEIPFFEVTNHLEPSVIDLLKSIDCSILINAGTPRILTSAFINSFDYILNCHPGFLPNYRGCSAVEWAIYNDDFVANTIHLMTPGIDEGPILSRQIIPISSSDCYHDIRANVYRF